MSWLQQNAIAIDQQVNALTGGMADETLSSRAWRAREHKYFWWTHRAINLLFFWQENHCLDAYQSEQLRKQLPKEFAVREIT